MNRNDLNGLLVQKDYRRCIEYLFEIIVSQNKAIESLTQRVRSLEKCNKLTEEVISPLVEDTFEPVNLMQRLELSQENSL